MVLTSGGAHADDDREWIYGTWVQSTAFITNIQYGFTEEACEVFFPTMTSRVCLERWRSLSLPDRYQFVRSEGSRFMLGLWERDRSVVYVPIAVEEIRKRRAGVPYETMLQFYRSYEDRPAEICVQQPDVRLWDGCLFLVGKMGFDAENDAVRFRWAAIVLRKHFGRGSIP